MHVFAVLADPVRRRIVEQLLADAMSSGDIVETIGNEFGISQSAISQQLKILRENRLATVQAEGTRRIYSLDLTGLKEVEQWLVPFKRFWEPKFAALDREIARGKSKRRKKIKKRRRSENET